MAKTLFETQGGQKTEKEVKQTRKQTLRKKSVTGSQELFAVGQSSQFCQVDTNQVTRQVGWGPQVGGLTLATLLLRADTTI